MEENKNIPMELEILLLKDRIKQLEQHIDSLELTIENLQNNQLTWEVIR